MPRVFVPLLLLRSGAAAFDPHLVSELNAHLAVLVGITGAVDPAIPVPHDPGHQPTAPGSPAPGAPAPPPGSGPGTPPAPPAPPPDGGPLPQGDIVVPEGRPPAELADEIKRRFPVAQWGNAARVSFYESGWRRTARNNTLDRGPCGTQYYIPGVGPAQTEDSIGYFQINRCAEGGTVEQWQDPATNVAKAFDLWSRRGWQPWTYTARRLGLI